MSASDRRIAVWVLISLALFTTALLIYGASAPIEISQPVSDGMEIELRPGVVAAQSFIAYFPGLNRISVQVARLPAGAENELNFWLNAGLPGEEGTLLRTPDVEVEYDRGWIHFLFPPQPAEGFRRYIFYIGTYSDEPVVLLGHSLDMYPQGTLINGFGDMVFEAGFEPSAEKTLAVMLARLKSNKPGVAGAGWVYALLLAGMFAAQVIFLERVLTTKEPEQEKRGNEAEDHTRE